MKRAVCLTLFLLPLLAMAQENKGIQFLKDLSWEQILAKAAKENKFVFVDCYATWCVPCKTMDNNVYPRGRSW